MLASTDPFYGVNEEVLQLELNKITEKFESKLSDSGRIVECEKKKVSFYQKGLKSMQSALVC